MLLAFCSLLIDYPLTDIDKIKHPKMHQQQNPKSKIQYLLKSKEMKGKFFKTTQLNLLMILARAEYVPNAEDTTPTPIIRIQIDPYTK